MKTRAVILAGGEGSRLGTLTAKRTKPAVPFAGKYRIIDFPLSNCVNSGIFDVMILSGAHIYEMNYDAMIAFHQDHHASLTMATIQVPLAEAPRFGIVGVSENYRVTSFVEKPPSPPSDMANMGVY